MLKLLKNLIVIPFIAGLILLVWAFVIEPTSLIVKDYDLKLKNWSLPLNGFKIVAIADIHGGSGFTNETKIREIVSRANAEEPDIIVLLGDYVATEYRDRTKIKMPMSLIADNLKGLKAKYGVYAVLGNHDGWYDDESVQKELERVGYPVIDNEAVGIDKDGQKLRLLGIADVLKDGNWGQNNSAAKAALERLPSKEGKIIMITHNPDALNYLTEEMSVSPDVALFIAGHTHGGQVRIPFFGSLISGNEFGRKYARGFIRDKGIDIFVASGIGTSIVPARFGVPPEISVLYLESEN